MVWFLEDLLLQIQIFLKKLKWELQKELDLALHVIKDVCIVY